MTRLQEYEAIITDPTASTTAKTINKLLAEGYRECWEGPEVKALVDALQAIATPAAAGDTKHASHCVRMRRIARRALESNEQAAVTRGLVYLFRLSRYEYDP